MSEKHYNIEEACFCGLVKSFLNIKEKNEEKVWSQSPVGSYSN
jgi:hypothetical protein